MTEWTRLLAYMLYRLWVGTCLRFLTAWCYVRLCGVVCVVLSVLVITGPGVLQVLALRYLVYMI